MKAKDLTKAVLTAFGLLLFLVLCQGNLMAQGMTTAGTAAAPAGGSADRTIVKGDTGRSQFGDLWKDVRFVFEAGGQIVSVEGERPSKFEEFRRIREGFVFRRFRVVSNPEYSPYFLRIQGQGPTEIDQQFRLEFGKLGKFETTASWSGSPHIFARGARTLFGQSGSNYLAVPDSIQTTLQNTASASLPSVVQSIMAGASTITLKTQRETLEVTQRVNLTKNWVFRFRFLDIKRYGMQPLGQGVYERVGTSTGDTFRVLSVELPQPVEYRSDEATFGTSYTREKWGINFDYTVSQFRNHIQNLIFDNPFRITDMQATGSGGVFDRMGFARGAYALPPSNYANSVRVSGFVDLPRNTRVSSAVGWSFWRQDEPFLPYTLNSAIVASGLPSGTTVTDTAALPQQSLNGEIDTFTQDHLLASRMWKNVRFDLHYRYYDLANNTHPIHFAGYAANGESFWRTNIAGVPIENEAVSFTKKNFTGTVVWDITKKVAWKGEYEWEGWDRVHRQVARSNEHKFATQLSFKPSNRFSGKLLYNYGDRTPESYYSGVKEFSELRMFDQAKRVRHDLEVQWQFQPRPDLGFSGTFSYLNDDYDERYFGLTRARLVQGSVDMLWMPGENATVYANYSREHGRNTMQTIAKTAAPYSLSNQWVRDERGILDTFGFGVTAFAARENRFLIDAHYALSFARDQFFTVNPQTPLANSILNATAYPFPEVRSRFQEVSVDASYQFSKNVSIGTRYLFEPYRLSDYAWDGFSPYPINLMPAEQDGRRFLVLDSRYSGHDAHAVVFYLRISR